MFKKILAITFAVMFLSSVLSVGSIMTPASAMAPPPAMGPNNNNSNFPQIVGNVTGINGPFDVAVNEKTNKIYITHFKGSITVIDGKTDKIIDTIPFSSTALNVATDENSNKIFVINNTNFQTFSLTVIDGNTDKITNVVPLASKTNGDIEFDHKTNKLYVSSRDVGVQVIDPETLKVIDTIPGDNASLLGIDEKTDRIYVTNYFDATISVIDGKTDQIIDTIPVGTPAVPDDCYLTHPRSCTSEGSGATGVAVNQETDTIYEANNNDGTFVTIDGKTDKVTNTITFSAPTLVESVVDEKTNTVYLLDNFPGVVYVIDGKTNKVIDNIPVGSPPSPTGCLGHFRCTSFGQNPIRNDINEKTGKIYTTTTDFASGVGYVIVIDANTHQMIGKMQMPMPPQPPNNNPLGPLGPMGMH